MKAIPAGNYLVRPFVTHKTQTYQYAYLSGSNPAQVTIDLAVATPTGSWQTAFTPASDFQNPSGIFGRPLYESVRHLFYSKASEWNKGVSLTEAYNPTASFYVVSFAQQSYGEGVARSSLTLRAAASTCSFQDDGQGRLLASTNGAVVGHILYGLGIAIIRQDVSSYSASVFSHLGAYLQTGSLVTVEYDASHTIYQHEVICTMEPGEMNYSSNPTVLLPSSSVSGTVKPLDVFASGTLTPYMTTVGLYSERGELVALGKFPRALKRVSESQQSIIIKFDI
jgi:hypothetical protein